ncbi:MAG: dTMP kinase [Pseudomonadota bacterium]|nr:dTMP kinase [Pseudomonadota bacterium]
MARGMFITLEGGEGSGKSTQIALLHDRLTSSGYAVVRTREPGGTAQAEAIRELMVRGEPGAWSPLAEALLMNAARDSHLRHLIRPALANGSIVLSDRFMDSTRAYQGGAGGIAREIIAVLERRVVGDTVPDLTLILDLDAGAGLARSGGRGGGAARFEGKGLAYHQAVRERFLDIAKSEPQRCVVIDAAVDQAEVAGYVWKAVERVLPKR